MCKRAALCLFVFFCALTIRAQDTYLVNHIAKEGWTTTLTVYNDGITDQTVTLHYWHHPSEPETTFSELAVPANSVVAFDNTLFGYDGVATIEAPANSTLRVKVSYRYGESHSLAEFLLAPDSVSGAAGTSWVIPNPYLAHMDWLGFAIANFNTDYARVQLTAYKDGAQVGNVAIDVIPNGKRVDLSSALFPGLDYADIDMVLIESDIRIPAPVAIIGNTEQDRHLFFPGTPHAPSGSIFVFPATYEIPHVAADNWHTTITAVSASDTDETLTLNSWNPDGSVDRSGVTFTVPTHGTLVLAAGTDFAYNGTAEITVNNTVRPKLSYQYQDSVSISDFMLTNDQQTEWILPNSVHDWFQWFGIAVANTSDSEIAVALDAYKDGVLLGTTSRRMTPHSKYVDLSTNIWPGIDYTGIDMVVVRSDHNIPAPISITGNTDQDRHVFFQGAFVEPDTETGVTDAAFDAFLLHNFDTDHNGSLSPAEVDAVTEIDTTVNNPWHGQIKSIRGVSSFTNLTRLNCQDEDLGWLPDMSPLTGLQLLKVSRNHIARIENLGSLPALNWCYLDVNNLDSMPDVSGLTDLRTLWVGHNQLSEIPGIDTLTRLEFLIIFSNQFTELPDLRASAANFVNLNADDNEIATIYDLSELPNLQWLSIRYNNLTSLPGIGSLTQLRSIYCDYNQIASLDALSGFTTLEYFGCSGNPIPSLPDLSGCTNMKFYYCSDTAISTIPGLAGFTHLQRLYCSGTQIADLSGISGLTEMQVIQCWDTPLTTFPDLSAMPDLIWLYCQNCLLTDIPDVTANTNLQVYFCFGNYFGADDCPLIQAISAMGIDNFIYNQQADGSTLTCP